ncbi:MAG: DUF4367 domain-containing protein [Chloroflexota bacterium]|nr:MAG: DUF4367 domain-containing protein [Chloroflexota bacterium]
MSEQQKEDFDTRIRSLAKDFPYPRTPDIAGGFDWKEINPPHRVIRYRRWALASILLIVLFASLVAVPEVRARLLEFLQIGSIRIQVTEPTLTSTASEVPGGVMGPLTATPDYGSNMVSLLELDGETTLDDVREKAEFPVRLPTYPPDLGEPGRVFYQQIDEQSFVVLVWLYPDTDDRVRISLYALGEGTGGFKGEPRVIEEIEVSGERAIWTDGPHLFTIDGYFQLGRLVESPVLIWTSEGLTYRLEGDLSKDEMIRIAESLE